MKAINEDYLVFILVTSQTRGKFKSLNLPFGLGKTTLALWLSYSIHNYDWEQVFEHLYYYPDKLLEGIEGAAEAKTRLPSPIWDDAQFTCPAEQSVPSAVRRMAGRLSTARAETPCVIMTAPNILSIAAPLRKLVSFEVIVWERAHFEIQQITYYKNFANPLADNMKLDFIEGDPEQTVFPDLPSDVKARYNIWRAAQKKPSDANLRRDLFNYVKRGSREDVDAPRPITTICPHCKYEWVARKKDSPICPRCRKRMPI